MKELEIKNEILKSYRYIRQKTIIEYINFISDHFLSIYSKATVQGIKIS